jgi:hypothetical protein
MMFALQHVENVSALAADVVFITRQCFKPGTDRSMIFFLRQPEDLTPAFEHLLLKEPGVGEIDDRMQDIQYCSPQRY